MKKIIILLLTIFLSACIVYERQGTYIAINSDYNKQSQDYGHNRYYISLPILQDSQGKLQNLSFGFVNPTGETLTIGTLLFIIPIPSSRGVPIEQDNNQLILQLFNTKEVDSSVFSGLNFYLHTKMGTYKANSKTITSFESVRTSILSKPIYQGVPTYQYIFPLTVKDLSQGGTIVVDYRGVKREVPIIFDTYWNVSSTAP